MRRQLLDPIGTPSVPDVVRRLCGVQAQVASSAELAIRVRRGSSQRGEVARALAEGRLIKTWAMRGTLHLLTPEDGGAVMGKAELGALLRHDDQALGRAPPGRPRRARGKAPDP